jgi:hypothetical protein
MQAISEMQNRRFIAGEGTNPCHFVLSFETAETNEAAGPKASQATVQGFESRHSPIQITKMHPTVQGIRTPLASAAPFGHQESTKIGD